VSQLRDLREKKGLSLQSLAQSAGVTPESICRYQSGARKPHTAVKRLMAQALEISELEMEQILSEPA